MADTENEEKERTFEDTMRDTMAAIQERDKPAADPVETTETPAAPDEPAKPAAEGRVRGPDGKFVKAAKPKEQVEDQPASESEPAPQPAKQVKAASSAPSGWSAAAKALWDTLDPVIRQEVLKRESDGQRGVQQYAEKAKRLEAIDAVIKPHHREEMVRQYGGVERGIEALLSLSDFATRDPNGFVAYFTQTRGLDPNQILQRGQQQFQGLPPVPQAANPLEQRLGVLEKSIQQYQNQSVDGLLKSFMAETDDKGNLKHPYFDELRNEIAAFLEMGKALPDAYESAVWASPAHREAVLQQRNSEADAAQKVEMERKAKEARQASTLAAVTRPNAGATPSKPKNWEDTLQAQYKRIQAGQAA